jgi:hypothetical protein
MYHWPMMRVFGRSDPSVVRRPMRKLLLVGLIALLISGCSFKQVWKWIDQTDWERDDKTITFMDFLIR